MSDIHFATLEQQNMPASAPKYTCQITKYAVKHPLIWASFMFCRDEEKKANKKTDERRSFGALCACTASDMFEVGGPYTYLWLTVINQNDFQM